MTTISNNPDNECGVPKLYKWKSNAPECTDEDDENSASMLMLHCQERQYTLYRPTIACQDEIVKLPLVVVFHCYGCSMQTMMHWTDIAERYNFVLIIPQGLHNSFNGRFCCGYALENNIDDFGFVQNVITKTLENNKAEASQGVESSNKKKEAVYAVGWSNGGYMSVYLSSLFRAVAPISGFQVLDENNNVLSTPSSKDVSIFLHHAKNDHFVQMTGCCTDSSMPKCCCHLDNLYDTCISVDAFWTDWFHKNQPESCKDEQVTTTLSNKNVTCRTRTCQKATSQPLLDDSRFYYFNATICLHEKGGHFNQPSHAKGFPMTTEIADFFARDACSIHGGTWSDTLRACTCQASFAGPYCLNGSTDASSPSSGSATSNEKNDNLKDEQVAVTNESGADTVIVQADGGSMWFLVLPLLIAMMTYFAKQQLRSNANSTRNKRKTSLELRTLSPARQA